MTWHKQYTEIYHILGQKKKKAIKTSILIITKLIITQATTSHIKDIMSYHNRNQNGKSFRNNNFLKKEQPSNLCDVCLKEPFKYKCSKCKNKAFKICSMDCYKQHNEKGEHYVIAEENKPDAVVEDDKESNEFQYLMQNEKIQSLLKYNTVKYHLHKIYQLLLLDHNSIQEDTIKNRKDLEQVIARYLSCFRQNGVYRNVAIEEFVQTCLEEISNHESKL